MSTTNGTIAGPLASIMSAPALTVPVTATLAEAAETMLERRVGSLLCTDPDGRLVGILTDSDFATRNVGIPFSTFRTPQLLGRWLGEDTVERIYAEARRRRVEEVMSAPVHAVGEDAGVEDVLALMLRHNIKHVPVVRNGYPVGMVSRHDLLKFLLDRLRD